jgi:CRISPR-associated endonuclease/helicase Cas3
MYYAHSIDNCSKSEWQALADHLKEVAAIAGRFAAPFGGQRSAGLAGLLHDLGKYTAGFQARLEVVDGWTTPRLARRRRASWLSTLVHWTK